VLDLWPDTLSAIGVVKSPRMLSAVGAMVRYIYRRCDRILIQSHAFSENVERFGGDGGSIRYFPGWAEAVFDGGEGVDAPVPELTPYASDFKVLFAGNIGQAQDFPAIIEAADLLRDEPYLRWIIVGDGRAGKDARADVERRGLAEKVIFLGRYELDRMPAFFSAADTLLVSLRDEPIWSMTIPGKVQSYLAAGKPLLGMLNGEGARVIEEARAGLTGPAGDAWALARNVRAMMACSPEARAAFGEAGRDYAAREFARSGLIDRLERWIYELQA
jgi:glycosyltransferase involved in cell wall biosynthesis